MGKHGKFPIGALLESFKLEDRAAMEKARELGIEGLQIGLGEGGERAPENMAPAKRKELLQIAKGNGLTVTAVCGDLGHGFGWPQRNPELIEKSKRILDLAKDLGTDVVTTHIGVVPPDPSHERYKIMQDACGMLARYADEVGAHFAVETGPEPAHVLRGFLDSLGSKGVSVNLDPANLVMVVADDPPQAVRTLSGYIVHTHAKDGRQLEKCDAEVVYGILPGTVAYADAGTSFIELPLGEGDVPWDRYLAALEEIGYKGYLTIEREVGDDPVKDIAAAVSFLKARI
jgi:sugar phosphate isomerase/epimerase